MPALRAQINTVSAPSHLPNFPRVLLQTLMQEGHTSEALLDGTGIKRADLEDETYRLSPEQHERFITRAIEVSNDPHLSLRVGRDISLLQSNLFLLTVANSGSVTRALQWIERYSTIYTRTLKLHNGLSEGDPHFLIEPQVRSPQVIYFATTTFSLFVDSVLRSALSGAHLVTRLELSIAQPEGFEDVKDSFGFPLSFSLEQSRLFLNPTLFDRPIQQADPQTLRLLMESCERQLEAARLEEGLMGRVTALIIDHVAAPPGLEQAAAMLHMSSRSLRRHLKEQGTSYQRILDDIRQDSASRLLRGSTSSVASIGYELGFDNPSHFNRAFKRWTGQTPRQYRLQQHR
ncbi:MAG: helix-turn-helix domain-containing protein [Pseudomonadota bacterium]